MEYRTKKTFTRRRHYGPDKTLEQFEDLKVRESFLREVNSFRKRAGIPEGDPSEWKEPEGFFSIGSEEGRERIKDWENTSRQIIEKFDLDNSFIQPIEIFMRFGDTMGEIYSPRDYPGCSLRVREDDITIKIYPGATERDIRRALHVWWPEIDFHLWNDNPKKHKTVYRSRRHRKRDYRIFELYEMGVISSDGSIDFDRATELIESGEIKEASNPEEFNAFARKLPGIDARKKIILREKKLRRS